MPDAQMHTAAWLLSALVATLSLPARASAADVEVIHELIEREGVSPDGSLALAPDGRLHGTATYSKKGTGGTLFSIGLDGKFSTDFVFSWDHNKRAGTAPQGGLIYANDGRFYGTTMFSRFARGAVFAMDANGKVKAIHSFSGGNDGFRPDAGVVQGSDGKLYGTTSNVNLEQKESVDAGCCGTVFSVTPDGVFKTLHVLKSNEGSWPNGLIEGTDGAFYGTTRTSGPKGGGTFFRMTAGGTLTVLYAFEMNGSNGYVPSNRLLLASDGNFYGGTAHGGEFGDGTLFRMTPAGEMTVLHSFQGAVPNGAWPRGTLIQASNGNIYGTTLYGGRDNRGTVFRLTLGGEVTTLYKFSGPDGENPNGGLTQASDGLLYGTTDGGGFKNYGVIYRMTAE